MAAGQTVTVNCQQNAIGQYVYIQIFGDNERLTLCEVEVEGHAPSGNAPFDFLKMNQY